MKSKRIIPMIIMIITMRVCVERSVSAYVVGPRIFAITNRDSSRISPIAIAENIKYVFVWSFPKSIARFMITKRMRP